MKIKLSIAEDIHKDLIGSYYTHTHFFGCCKDSYYADILRLTSVI